MDFQKVVDSMAVMTCVMSVEKLDGDRYGKLRIVTGNRAYIDSIEQPLAGQEMLKSKFVPNSEYTDYLQRDLNFEDFCYRAAVQKKCMHAYVHPERRDIWYNLTAVPLEPDEGNLCFCTYSLEVNFEASSEILSNVDSTVSTDVLKTCILLKGTKNFKLTMQKVIQGIRDLCDAEHCCILLMNHKKRTCSMLCEAFSKDTDLISMEAYLDGFYDIAASWEATIAGSSCLIAKNERDMEVVKERNPVWYDSITGAGGRTIVLFPLKFGEKLLGYMWAINFSPDRASRIKDTLELTTFILGSEIDNYLMVDRLKTLSSRDMLTGVQNRNEMNIYVEQLGSRPEHENKSVGVVFADLNGLKVVNDEEGHFAGDDLLKTAAKVLGEVFAPEEIFRAGGDEFCMILTDVTEEVLREKAGKVKEIQKKYDRVSFSIGCAVRPECAQVREALKVADALMYEDKRNYYARHPEKKRRTVLAQSAKL